MLKIKNMPGVEFFLAPGYQPLSLEEAFYIKISSTYYHLIIIVLIKKITPFIILLSDKLSVFLFVGAVLVL